MSNPPPVLQSIDANSVDLITGALTVSVNGLSIGQAGAGGLSYGRSLVGNGWRDSFLGLINVSGAVTTVSIGGSSEAFTLSGSVYTPTTLDGATLTLSGTTYTYTQRDGTVLTFSPSQVPYGPSGYNTARARLTQIIKPDGEVDTFNYKTTTFTIASTTFVAERVASYSNNLGYEIDLSYPSNTAIVSAYQVSQAMAVNHAFPSAGSMPTVSLATTTTSSGGTGTLTDALGRVQSFTYDTSGHLTGYAYPSGSSNTTTITYDSSGRVSTLTNGVGAKWSYAYSGTTTNQTTTVTDPLGHTRTVVSNPSTGLIASDADGLGHTTRYTYDGATRLLTSTTPNGVVTTNTYDGRGNVTQKTITAAGGASSLTTSATYDASCTYPIKCNQPNTTTDARGAVTHYYYNNNTFLNTIVYPAGADGTSQQVDWTYNQYYAWYTQNGSLAQAPSPVWPVNFYSQGCPTAQTCWTSRGQTQTIPGYTASGSASNLLPISMATGKGDASLTATTSMSFDAVGNLYTTSDAYGHVTRYRYDVARQPVGVVGPDPDGSGALKNRGTRYIYDGAGRVTEVDRGSVASQSDADWSNFQTLASHSAYYDAIGNQLLAYVGPGGASTAVTHYTYDAARRLTCTAVRMNAGAFNSLPASACSAGALGPYGPDRITYNTYDAANHLTQVTSGYGTNVQRNEVTTTYGSDGETLTQADAKGNLTTYAYDGFDRLIQVNFPLTGGGGKSSGSDFKGYSYDANSNVVSARMRDGQTVGYTYDARNRLTQGVYGATYAYDTLGRMISASLSNQTTSYAWDALSRQLSETGPLGTLSRQYDLDGNLARLTYPDGFYITYGYDVLGEAVAINDSAVSLAQYAYDDLGRRTEVYRPGVSATFYSYGPDLNLSSMAHTFVDTSKNETFGFWYNAAGQVRSSTSSNAAYDWNAPANVGRNYAVDGQNRYTTAGSLNFGYDARGNLSSDSVNGYGYDVINRLTSLSNNATLTYDATSRLFQTTGSSTTRFLYDGDQIVGEYDGAGNLLRRYVPGPSADETIVWYEGSGTTDRRWLVPDRQGSIIAVANASGTTIGINTYDESGIPGSGNIGRFQFDAMAWVPEAGLYHARARAYSPTLGRFMQSDPIGYGDGMNFFNFAHGDPVNRSDPSGLSDSCSIIPGGQSFSEDGNTATVGDATLCYQTPDPPDPGTELDLPPSLTIGTGFPGLRGLNKTPHSLSPPQSGQPKSGGCEAALGVAEKLENVSKATGVAALGAGVTGLAIEGGTLGVGTPVAAGVELGAGLSELTSLVTGGASALIRTIATGNLTSLSTFATYQAVVNGSGLGGISALGKVAASALGVGYDFLPQGVVPESVCP